MKKIATFNLVVAVIALLFGCLSLASNSMEAYPVPLLFALCFTLSALFISARIAHRETNISLIIFAVLALGSAIILSLLPEYLYGLNVSGVVHRSIISALILLVIGITGISYSLFYLLGSTPSAHDISRYPLLALPIVLIGFTYLFIIWRIVSEGAPQLDWSLLVTPYKYQIFDVEIWQNGWPSFVLTTLKQIGMLNHILGTFLLMGLTALISLPIGMGIGIFVYAYAGPRLGGIIRFSSTALRAISGIILAVTAVSLISLVTSSTDIPFINYLVSGFGYYANGELLTGRSSYIIASFFVSLFVIPVIARATEEGLNSLPKDIIEGSLAAGASEEHTLKHISIPWSLPNIITALVLGCGEAAGALAIIFLIAGTGELGVNPLSETTSLAYFIFECSYGNEMGDAIQLHMGSYGYTAAFLLLIITLVLTITALIIKNKFAQRYKGI